MKGDIVEVGEFDLRLSEASSVVGFGWVGGIEVSASSVVRPILLFGVFGFVVILKAFALVFFHFN